MSNQCEHGQLKRQCQICEMQVELDELSEELSRANAESDRLQSECYELGQQNRELDSQNLRLAANQCHCGYGDAFGNHRCKYQDCISVLEKEVNRLTALCDTNYVAGMKAGWNYCVDDDSEGMQKSIEDRQKPAIRELKTLKELEDYELATYK